MSWQQLIDIQKEAAALKRQEEQQGPQACPDDGEPWTIGPDGEKFCRFCGRRVNFAIGPRKRSDGSAY